MVELTESSNFRGAISCYYRSEGLSPYTFQNEWWIPKIQARRNTGDSGDTLAISKTVRQRFVGQTVQKLLSIIGRLPEDPWLILLVPFWRLISFSGWKQSCEDGNNYNQSYNFCHLFFSSFKIIRNDIKLWSK